MMMMMMLKRCETRGVKATTLTNTLKTIYFITHKDGHIDDGDAKRCENEGGQSHYFGCQLGAGKSLNLSNVFHPRQVIMVLICDQWR